MSHAQRLLPIEQLLSDAAAMPAGLPRTPGKPDDGPRCPPDLIRLAKRGSNAVSPFAADSARKGITKPQLSADTSPGPRVAPATPVVMGSALPVEAIQREIVQSDPVEIPLVRAEPERIDQPAVSVVPVNFAASAPASDEEAREPSAPVSQSEALRNAVLNSLSGAGHRMLVNMLENGEWLIEGNELVVKVSSSAMVIDMSLGADAKRIAIATASGTAGRPLKFKVLPGGSAQAAVERPASNGSGRSRAEQDPIVRRMKEKFGAEIRTIIDHREKR